MRNYLFLVLLLISTLYPQTSKSSPDYFHSSVIYIPSDSAEAAYFIYRLQYSSLVFEKEEEYYKAGYRLSLEIFDSDGFVSREIVEDKVITTNYDETDSKEVFKEGFIRLRIAEGEFKLWPILTDLKSQNEIKLDKIDLKINKGTNYFQPLIINIKSCQGLNYKLAGFDGNYPFDNKEYELLIPVRNISELKYYEINNNGSSLVQGEIKDIIIKELIPISCSGEVFLERKQSEGTAFIKLNPGNNIYEGELKIRILDENKKELYSVSKVVEWYNKPRTLRDNTIAIRLLETLEDKESFKYLYDEDQDFDSLFFSFWKKYDPTPESAFNELMDEFYKRADYAAANFSSITGKSGLDNDRGKIYIKFGKPKSVTRVSNEDGKIIEIWSYGNNKKFSFIDEKGTGEFSLMKS